VKNIPKVRLLIMLLVLYQHRHWKLF
jgi:hypothetical protein